MARSSAKIFQCCNFSLRGKYQLTNNQPKSLKLLSQIKPVLYQTLPHQISIPPGCSVTWLLWTCPILVSSILTMISQVAMFEDTRHNRSAILSLCLYKYSGYRGRNMLENCEDFWKTFGRENGWTQGLVNVPFWEYWTSPYSSHLVDHIPNGWVMWKMGTWLMTHGEHGQETVGRARFFSQQTGQKTSKNWGLQTAEFFAFSALRAWEEVAPWRGG